MSRTAAAFAQGLRQVVASCVAPCGTAPQAAALRRISPQSHASGAAASTTAPAAVLAAAAQQQQHSQQHQRRAYSGGRHYEQRTAAGAGRGGSWLAAGAAALAAASVMVAAPPPAHAWGRRNEGLSSDGVESSTNKLLSLETRRRIFFKWAGCGAGLRAAVGCGGWPGAAVGSARCERAGRRRTRASRACAPASLTRRRADTEPLVATPLGRHPLQVREAHP